MPNASQHLRRLDYRVNSWDVAFREFITKLESQGKPVILAGDLNVAHNEIDIHDPVGKPRLISADLIMYREPKEPRVHCRRT